MWMSTVLPALVGLFIIFVPGLLVTLAVRLKGFDALAIAPAISVALVAISAIIAPMLGVDWALWVPFAFALIIALLGFALVVGLKAGGLFDAPYKRSLSTTIHRTSMRWKSACDGWYVGAFLVAAILLVRNMTNAIGEPDWVSQTWDNTFHLNAVRYVVDNANGSGLFLGTMTSRGKDAEFYPAAWHDLVSLVFMHSGASIPVAVNTVVVLIASVIWPLSILYMVRSIFPAGRFALLVTAIAAASMPSFPYLLIFFGVLYPNLLGYSLLPLGIGMMAQLFRVGTVRYLATTQSLFLGFFVALGTALAHPNAVMSLLVIVVPVFVARAVLQIIAAVKKETSAWGAALQVCGVAVIIFVINYLWGVVRPPEEAGAMWDPSASQGAALGELLTNQAIDKTEPLWLLTILSLIGCYAIIRSKSRLYWVVGTWIVLAYFYIAIRSLGWEDGRYDVVGVWYNDAFRVAALVPAITLIFVAFGAHYLASAVSSTRFRQRTRTAQNRNKVLLGAGAVGVVVFGVLTQSTSALTSFIERTFWAYAPTSESQLLSPDEAEVLAHVDDYVAEDEGIVVNAFNGGPLAYALAERPVSAYHVSLWDDMTPDEQYIYRNLNQAMTDPKVCQILNEHNWGYYLEFGHIEVNGANHDPWYRGFEEVVENGVVTEVYRAGGAKLYEITACE